MVNGFKFIGGGFCGIKLECEGCDGVVVLLLDIEVLVVLKMEWNWRNFANEIEIQGVPNSWKKKLHFFKDFKDFFNFWFFEKKSTPHSTPF